MLSLNRQFTEWVIWTQDFERGAHCRVTSLVCLFVFFRVLLTLVTILYSLVVFQLNIAAAWGRSHFIVIKNSPTLPAISSVKQRMSLPVPCASRRGSGVEPLTPSNVATIELVQSSRSSAFLAKVIRGIHRCRTVMKDSPLTVLGLSARNNPKISEITEQSRILCEVG